MPQVIVPWNRGATQREGNPGLNPKCHSEASIRGVYPEQTRNSNTYERMNWPLLSMVILFPIPTPTDTEIHKVFNPVDSDHPRPPNPRVF